MREIYDIPFTKHFVPTQEYIKERDGALKNYRANLWETIHCGSYPDLYCSAYRSGALKRAIRTPKMYFRDTGLCCYLTRWLMPDTLKNGAMAAAMFETFAINEILKSYSNEGLEYDFNVFYYNGKDRKKKKEDGI